MTLTTKIDIAGHRGMVGSALDRKLQTRGYAADGLVEMDPRDFRPTEVESLLGDAAKARDELVKRHGFNAPNYAD